MKKVTVLAAVLAFASFAHAQAPDAGMANQLKKDAVPVEKQAEEFVVNLAEFFAMPALMQDLCKHSTKQKARFQSVFKMMRTKLLDGHTPEVTKQFDAKYLSTVEKLRTQSKSVPSEQIQEACVQFNKNFDGEMDRLDAALKKDAPVGK
ncbi:hypothetical protein LC612_36595 [Nostoc sp. CHAB 5834]|nr:hypothetical protein [Nostoc sp. CHAB 5834]